METLSTLFQDIHLDMAKYETTHLPFNNETKAPWGAFSVDVGDIVYKFTPRGIPNLSRKLTLRWIRPFQVVENLMPSLGKIFPVRTWMQNKQELQTLTSKLIKINPKLS